LATDRDFTRILDWPGYRVYQHEIDEKAKTLKLWIRRKRGNRRLECSGCGRKFTQIYDTGERAVRDLPWSGFTATVFVEVYRVPWTHDNPEQLPDDPRRSESCSAHGIILPLQRRRDYRGARFVAALL